SRVRGGRRSDELRSRGCRHVSSSRNLRRPHPQRREGGGPAGPAGHESRVGPQHEDCEGARSYLPAFAARSRRRGDRVSAKINSREFITLLGGAAAWPVAARAQQPTMPVIGYFSTRSPDAEAPLRVPFLKALEGSGFTAGRNVAIEYRFAEGQHERLPVLAA